MPERTLRIACLYLGSSVIGKEENGFLPTVYAGCRPFLGRSALYHVLGRFRLGFAGHKEPNAVSYTHLTLPTICSV